MSPEIPPEAEVIRLAREAMDMTAQGAAEASRAGDGKGISAAYWRDVERGYGGRRGQRVPVRASARALAAMARVVDVMPSQLAGAGREDAARVLTEILRRENPARLAAVPPASAPESGLTTPASFLPPDMLERTRPYAEAVWARYGALLDQGIPDPDGAQMFGPGEDAADWDRFRGRGFSARDRSWLLGALQEGTESSRDRGTGLAALSPDPGIGRTIFRGNAAGFCLTV